MELVHSKVIMCVFEEAMFIIFQCGEGGEWLDVARFIW